MNYLKNYMKNSNKNVHQGLIMILYNKVGTYRTTVTKRIYKYKLLKPTNCC